MRYPPRHSLQKISPLRHRRYGPQRGVAGGQQAGMIGNAVFLLLALAVLAVLMSVAYTTTTSAALPLAGAAAKQSTQSPSTTGDPWIPLHSQAPGDILAAARQSALFQESRSGTGDQVHDLSRLGRPVLVSALRPAGVSAAEVPDFYIVPILNQAGATTDAAELALNPAHTAVQVIAIVTYTVPRTGGSVALLSADQATRTVASQYPEAAQPIRQPYLVYFPLDPAWQASQNGQNGQHVWLAGGALPADPVWLVTAAKGKQYLAGDDGKTYDLSQLPFWKG